MRRIVEDLIRVDGVIGSLLVGKDGLVVASTLMDEEDAEILGAMSAAVFGEIDKATKRIGVGTLVDSIIDAKDGSILLLEAKELILVVITQRTVGRPCFRNLFSLGGEEESRKIRVLSSTVRSRNVRHGNSQLARGV